MDHRVSKLFGYIGPFSDHIFIKYKTLNFWERNLNRISKVLSLVFRFWLQKQTNKQEENKYCIGYVRKIQRKKKDFLSFKSNNIEKRLLDRTYTWAWGKPEMAAREVLGSYKLHRVTQNETVKTDT